MHRKIWNYVQVVLLTQQHVTEEEFVVNQNDYCYPGDRIIKNLITVARIIITNKEAQYSGQHAFNGKIWIKTLWKPTHRLHSSSKKYYQEQETVQLLVKNIWRRFQLFIALQEKQNKTKKNDDPAAIIIHFDQRRTSWLSAGNAFQFQFKDTERTKK